MKWSDPIEPIEPIDSIDSIQPVEPIDPIEPIEPIEQVASNRTQINQSIRSEMASRSMTQSATTQVDGFCPHCGKQFSMRGMTRHKNKCKENQN